MVDLRQLGRFDLVLGARRGLGRVATVMHGPVPRRRRSFAAQAGTTNVLESRRECVGSGPRNFRFRSNAMRVLLCLLQYFEIGHSLSTISFADDDPKTASEFGLFILVWVARRSYSCTLRDSTNQSIKRRAILKLPGILGNASRRNQPASMISLGSGQSVPPA